jgi:CheY-like chemotaxis protein
MTQGRVLVIDDNVELAENIQEILEDEGFSVTVAFDGTAGVEALAADAHDIVITDMRMPGMGGLEVLRWSKERRPELPVIVMTAYTRDDVLDDAQAAGAVGIVHKPFEMAHLVEQVRRVCGHGSQVLIVEDDVRYRSNLVEVLAEIPGVVVHPVATITQAKVVAERIPLAAAIIDIRLPDGDGVELGRDLAQRPGKMPKIVYVTGYAESARERLLSFLERPEVLLLSKPFQPAALVQALRELASGTPE